MMKSSTWWYLWCCIIAFLLLLVLFVQNLGVEGAFGFLWVKGIQTSKLIFLTASLGLVLGCFLLLLLQSFFLGIKAPELSKFELDKPL